MCYPSENLALTILQGQKALTLSTEGQSGVMVTLNRLSNDPYTVSAEYMDIHDAANMVKNVPVSWITPDGHDVTEEMLDYLRPLIVGEPSVSYKNGLPEYLSVEHLI